MQDIESKSPIPRGGGTPQGEIIDRRGARSWVIGGLFVYLLAVGAVLLLPISYAEIVTAIGDWLRGSLGIGGFGTGWIEFITNILMFAPLGLLMTLLFRHPWKGTLLAVLLSMAAEVAQFIIPSRQPSLRDVLANAVGAALGAAVAWVIVRRRKRRERERVLSDG